LLAVPFLGESPFSPVQLLWINMIMDTLASLALSTEHPNKNIMNGPPFKESTELITPPIWRQVFGVSIFQTIIMAVVVYAGPSLWGFNYKFTDTTTCVDPTGYTGCADKKKHMTLLFNIFVQMQLFN